MHDADDAVTPEPELESDLDPEDGNDPVLREAGRRLRDGSRSVSPAAVEVAALRRRSRRLSAAVGGAAAVVAVLGATVAVQLASNRDGDGDGGRRSGSIELAAADDIVASLGPLPVDPTTVQLVSRVATFGDCDALLADLRSVGARHVGSRGFGGEGSGGLLSVGRAMSDAGAEAGDGAAASQAGSPPVTAAPLPMTGTDEGGTLGTNVQVAGVDELDRVKAEGRLLYDLDAKGALRITDAETRTVLSTLAVTPEGVTSGPGDLPQPQASRSASVHDLLVRAGKVVLIGQESELSAPVAGDPSATQSSTSYLTVTFVDATDPAAPTVTDRIRVEGSLVSARLVDGEVRLVATSHMADLGFLMPTTPTSVPKALDANRRSVASSAVTDWIPDWQRDGEEAQPLVPCERVHVPETFSGVAMTSMVTFPIDDGRFAPAATSILAPGTTLYAGLEKVAISSEVWVDPAERGRLRFDDWKTAIHEFGFGDGEAPGYRGSGIVDGSTVGQFAFGEVGDDLAVVTTEGTPWQQNPDVSVDLTVLRHDGVTLAEAAKVDDLADGDGAVNAVRFVDRRVLISTGMFGRAVHVLDVSDPAAPRRAGTVTIPGDVGYFHPLPDGQALILGSRSDTVGTGQEQRSRQWVYAHLLDVADADAPAILATWERPWSSDIVGADHHAFTYWPDRNLAMWGIADTQWFLGRQTEPNHAIVLETAGGLDEVALPEASKPPETAPPCPVIEITDPEARAMAGIDRGGVVLRCDEPGRTEIEWPRYMCSAVDSSMVARFIPDGDPDATYAVCSEAPPPTVARVLVIGGVPMLYTDQTLESLDPTTFASTGVTYRRNASTYRY